MPAAERAPITQRGEQKVRPLSEYPGPQTDIVGSTLRKGPDGGLVRDYYYKGHIPGGEHVIGYSGRETRIEHPQQPGRAIKVFDVRDRQSAPAVPLRKG